jgi:hypothetical protein
MSNNGQQTDKDTHVTLLPSTELNDFQRLDALAIVELLENCAGDITNFMTRIPQNNVPAEFIIYHCEKALSALEDKSLYKRWNESIRLGKVSKLRVLQQKAFTALETAGNDLTLSPKNALDFAKVVLQEFLVQQAQASKNALGMKEPEKDDDAEFEADLAEMEELGK